MTPNPSEIGESVVPVGGGGESVELGGGGAVGAGGDRALTPSGVGRRDGGGGEGWRGTASSGGGAVGEEIGEWMRLALVEARAALDSGDVPVGAVVVDKLGEVIGAGRNRREDDADPTAHAEVLALRAAAKRVGTWRLEGCTLVSTLEPCPMCAGAAVAARVQRVVFGAWDPKAGAAGSVWDLLRDRRLNHRPEVLPGQCAEESTALLKTFFTPLR